MTTGAVNMGQTRVNHASSLIIEDHLKKVISKTATKGWKASDNPFLPRSQHSAFGDFPKDYMPKKTAAKAETEPIEEEAKKTFKSKFRHRFLPDGRPKRHLCIIPGSVGNGALN